MPCQEAGQNFSVLQALQRGGDTAAAADELVTASGMKRHDGRFAQQAAELDPVAHALADGGDKAAGGRFVVDDANGGFVGDDGGNRLGGGVAGKF